MHLVIFAQLMAKLARRPALAERYNQALF